MKINIAALLITYMTVMLQFLSERGPDEDPKCYLNVDNQINVEPMAIAMDQSIVHTSDTQYQCDECDKTLLHFFILYLT